MSFFGKSGKSKGKAPKPQAAAPEEGRSEKKPAAKPKKRGDTMAAVLKESVVETMIEEMSQNAKFIHDDKYVGLFFETERIGGLTKKSAKNEDKGSIIEAINSGRISALITDELMELEAMVLIPNATTVDAMDEYGILRDLDYPLCYVSPEGDVDILETTVTVEQLNDILQSGNDTVSSLLGEEKPAAKSDEGEPVVVSENELMSDEEAAASAPIEENETPFASAPVPEQKPMRSVQAPKPAAAPVFPADDDDDDEDEGAWSGGNYGQTEQYHVSDDDEDETESSVDLSEYETAIKRRIYSDDLGLEVSTDQFDAQFLYKNVPPRFDEERGDGWMNNYLTQLSKNANADMDRLHRDNLMRMRNNYFSMVSMFAMDLARELKTEDPNSEFGKLRQAIEDAHEQALADLPEAVSRERDRLEDEWQNTLASVGQAAQLEAQSAHKERYGKQHTDAMQRVEATKRAEIEDKYQDNLRSLNDDRRATATERLDAGINAALSAVAAMYSECQKEEETLYKKHEKTLDDFMQMNIADEKARIATLQRDNEITDRANQVAADYTARIQDMTADFEARQAQMRADMDESLKNSRKLLNDKDAEYRDRLRKASEENQTLNERITQLLGDMARLDDKKEAEYQVRIDDLVGERNAFSQKYDHLVDMQKKGSVLLVTLGTVGVIAALVIGFVIGEYVNIKAKSAEAKRQISEDLNQKLDDLNFDLPEGWTANVSEDGRVTISQVVPEE